MFQRIYYVPKASGTLADTLLAFGFAQILEDIIIQIRGEDNTLVILEDKGGYFQIDAGTTIQEDWIERLKPWDRLPYVLGGRKFTAPPSQAQHIAIRNANEEWERFRRYNQQRQLLNERNITGQEKAQALEDLKPSADWTIVTFLTDFRMQKLHELHNTLALQWHLSSQEYLTVNVRTLLAMFASLDAPIENLRNNWRKQTGETSDRVTAIQAFNPHMGKGQNRPKANKLTLNNEKSFWLLEYLKAIGVWLAAAPRTVNNANLRKTYVLSPRKIALRHHKDIFRRFLNTLWNDTAIKMDIAASLLYTQTLLDYAVGNNNLGLFQARQISKLVSGMSVATYQLLSANAYTMMSLAFLGLPNWMLRIQTREDVSVLQSILQEHYERIRAIDETHSEGYNLLRRYRDFVSSNDFETFYDFLADYSQFLMSALDRGHFYIRPFTEANLRRLIQMSQPKLSSILQSQGFQNIAEAIRRSTVIPQYIGRQQSQYDIRYGLGQELKRKAQYPDEFIQALADFVHRYNEENARVHERTKGKGFHRKSITTQDLEEVVALVDEFGSRTIANLLVAFGYARDPKESQDDSQTES